MLPELSNLVFAKLACRRASELPFWNFCLVFVYENAKIAAAPEFFSSAHLAVGTLLNFLFCFFLIVFSLVRMKNRMTNTKLAKKSAAGMYTCNMRAEMVLGVGWVVAGGGRVEGRLEQGMASMPRVHFL